MFLKDLWRRRACDSREGSCQALQPTPGSLWWVLEQWIIYFIIQQTYITDIFHHYFLINVFTTICQTYMIVLNCRKRKDCAQQQFFQVSKNLNLRMFWDIPGLPLEKNVCNDVFTKSFKASFQNWKQDILDISLLAGLENTWRSSSLLANRPGEWFQTSCSKKAELSARLLKTVFKIF